MLLRAHTGVTGADFVQFMAEVEEYLTSNGNPTMRIRLVPIQELEENGVDVEGEVPDPDMSAFLFEEEIEGSLG